jgi:phosphoribosylaminoimidazole synthetase
VLEFNARFGDPETQAILPLLDSDLLEILLACTQGRLDRAEVRWKDAAAACVVLASAGYPEHPAQPTPIHGLDALPPDSVVFQAGTRAADGQVLASGGRVLGVTATAGALPDAVQAAYRAVSALHFAGAQYRRDIAARALRPSAQSGDGASANGAVERSSASEAPGASMTERSDGAVERSSTSEALCASMTERSDGSSAYQKAGVDIDAGNRAVDLLRASVTSTYDARVIKGVGSFGGLFDAAQLKAMDHPVLVSSTDGVGTKVKLAAALGRCRGVGMDIVNHCIDDILVHGARPLFFLDYFAAAHLDPERVAEIVDGMAEACRAAGCVLIGGETAEMPGVYAAGEFDIAGTIVGCLERDRLLPRAEIRPGDVLIGLRSSGPHTNGYSLLRSIFAQDDLNAPRADLDGASLADALLAPHRSYLNLLRPLIDDPRAALLGIAHITGGGFIENLPRILPEGVGARIQAGSWPVPPLFRLAQQRGAVADAECYRVFNMGIGLVLVVRPEDAAAVQAAIPEPTWVIGETVAWNAPAWDAPAWNAPADSRPRVEVC